MDEPQDKPKQSHATDETSEAQDEIERVRELILQRRNRFVALALAGVGAASNACGTSHVCLSLAAPTSGTGGVDGTIGGGGVAGPRVCLTAWPPIGSGGAGLGGVAGAPPVPPGGTGGTGGVAGSAGVPPTICLDVEVCWNNEPPPCVCLEPPFVPEDDAGVEEP